VTMVPRSLHDGPFPLSGSGRVPEIGHLHCPGCDPNWKAPVAGSGITPAEIVTVS
jgi:hypothetical protein